MRTINATRFGDDLLSQSIADSNKTININYTTNSRTFCYNRAPGRLRSRLSVRVPGCQKLQMAA